MSIENNNETPETIQAEDIEGYMDKQRLKSLFDARNQAATAIRDASLNQLKCQERGASHKLAQNIVTDRIDACVRAYVSECEPLLRNTDAGQELLYNNEITTFTVPRHYNGRLFSQVVDLPCGELDGREITINGLDEYLRFDGVTAEYGEISLEETSNGLEPQPPERTEIPLPARLSESVFRELNQLLADLDIGLSAETQEETEYEMQYDDLL
jgi:hypothetical protein